MDITENTKSTLSEDKKFLVPNMGKSIIVTEKPSVARTYAKVVGVSGSKTDGYIENDKWIITWCVGHLVTLSYPETYDEDLKNWSMETLPFLPKQYKYEVIPDVKKQFNIVKKLYNRKDVDRIYYAGDSGREGIYIQMLVRQEAGLTPGIEERVVWIDSQTEDEIKRGLKEAKPLSEYQNLADSGYIRGIEDYSIGINFSRVLTLKYKAALGLQTPISTGRVMTCVLGMIVQREKEIENFKSTKFYKIHSRIQVDGVDIEAEWKPKEDSIELYNGTGFKDKQKAEEFSHGLPSSLQIEKVEQKNEKKYANLLFNQTELQAYCSKNLKISPDETLEISQSLYEKKLTTYPRTSARVLSSAIAKEISINLKGLIGYSNTTDIAIKEAFDSGRVKSIINSKYTNDAEVEDHYAIIPTGINVDKINHLNDKERTVYDYIVKRFVSIFMEPAVYKKIKITERVGEHEFITTGSALLNEGFYSVTGVPKITNSLPPEADMIKEKQTYAATYSIIDGETKPPARYTSGSIVLAMENAGNYIENEELREQIKKSGIGTDATRADTIKKLIKIKHINLNTKTQVITPNPQGRIIYEIINSSIPGMLNPEMTASWEKGLSSIAKGEITKYDYLEKLEKFVTAKVNSVKEAEISNELYSKIEPFKKLIPKDSSQKKFKVNAEVYLKVPYEEAEKVKSLGAWWDSERGAWYVPKGRDTEPFKKWLSDEIPKKGANKKIYLKVPYEEKDAAKKIGARWDTKKSQWYVLGNTEKKKYEKWL